MKLNINKLQSGGDIYFSAVANPYSRSAVADRLAQVASSSGSSKDTGLIPDKLMEKLYENGIPNDVDNFMNMLADFERRADFGLGINKQQLYNLRAYANQIVKLSTYLDKAEKQAEVNGSLDEYAVDNLGFLYVAGEKGLEKVHMSKFKADELYALTVGELLQQRKFNPQLVDNSSVVTTIGSSIGLEKINTYILDIIKAVGSTDNSSEAYQEIASIVGRDLAQRPSEELQAALQELYSWVLKVGPDAIFKVKDQFKSKNMDAAMSYIMRMLPNNMRLTLMARNVINGGKYENGNKYAWEILQNAAQAGNDIKIAHGIDYLQDINKGAGTTAGAKDHAVNMTGLEQLILGSLGSRYYTIVDKYNPNLAFTLQGNGLGKLTDAENKLVNESILQEALDRGLGALIDTNNIFFGDQKITPHMLDKIVYDGNDVINIWAPVNADGSIDLNKLKAFEEIKSLIKNNPYLTQADIKLMLNQIGLNGVIDAKGNFIGSDPNMLQFIVLTGITSDKVIDQDNALTTKLIKTDKDNTFKKIKLLYAEKNKGRKGDARYEFPQGWFEWSTNLVTAPVFMRVGQTARFDAGTIVGNGARIISQPYENLIQKDLAQRINKPSSSIL